MPAPPAGLTGDGRDEGGSWPPSRSCGVGRPASRGGPDDHLPGVAHPINGQLAVIDPGSGARAATDLPLYGGFGISSPAHAAAVAGLADGVVVGSRAVEVAEAGPAALEDYVRTLRAAIDR